MNNLYVYSNGHSKRGMAVFTCALVHPVCIAGKFPIFSSYSIFVISVGLYVAVRRKVRKKARSDQSTLSPKPEKYQLFH